MADEQVAEIIRTMKAYNHIEEDQEGLVKSADFSSMVYSNGSINEKR